MSENRKNDLSSEELSNLISDAFCEEEIDFELLDGLLDMQEKRGEAPGVDIDTAWERFGRDYAGRGEIYLTDDAGSTDNAGRANKNTRPRKRNLALHLGSIAALFVICTILIVATPLGESAGEAFTGMFGNTFDSAEPVDVEKDDKDDKDSDKIDGSALEDYDIPEGARWSSSFFGSIQSSDDSDVITYTRDGIEFLIMPDPDGIRIEWSADDYERCIIGDISIDEAIRIIDSLFIE